MADKDLQTGMFFSKDVRSGTGLLLLRKGTKLDDKNIQALKRYYRLDPSSSGFLSGLETKQADKNKRDW